jgi:hypothetical protein
MRGTLAFLSVAIVCAGCGGIAAGTYPGPAWQKTPSPRAEKSSSQPVQKVDSTLFCQPTTTHSADPPNERTPAKPSRDPASIQETVRAAFPDFRGCYEAALGRKRDATGRVQVRFAVDASGDIANACIEPPVLQDGVAVQCILDRFKKLQFGAGGLATVVYPIMLKPGPEPSAASARK